jgi:glycine betaine catabolism A
VVSTHDVSSGQAEIPLASSLPAESYTSAGQFAREREAVLFADWFCVGRTESLASPGDYLTADIAGESVVVVRQKDGLAGFYNLCRHRGCRVLPTAGAGAPGAGAPGAGAPGARAGGEPDPAGPARAGHTDWSIRCPYHGWTYGLDGRLRSAPFLPDLRRYRDQLALHPVAVDSWGGFVFARLGPVARTDVAGRDRENHGTVQSMEDRPLTAQLDGADERLAGYPLADLRSARRIVYRVAANWKVICENYNECYHCGPVHPELCDLVPEFRRGGGNGLDWDAGIPHRPGAYTFTVTGTTSRAPFPGLSAADIDRHRGEIVLPNLMLSLSCDHVAAFTLWPHDAGHTTVVCDFLFHPAEIARDDFDPADAVEFWDLVNRQDWAICEQVQDGMSSRMFTAGYMAPMEQPSADVGRYVARRLGPPSRDGSADGAAPGSTAGPRPC